MLNSVASCVEYWLVKFDVNSGSVLIFNERDDSASPFESTTNARDLASDCAAIYFCDCHNFISVFSYTISLILYLRAVFRTELGCKYTTIICSNKFLFVNFQIIFCVSPSEFVQHNDYERNRDKENFVGKWSERCAYCETSRTFSTKFIRSTSKR